MHRCSLDLSRQNALSYVLGTTQPAFAGAICAYSNLPSSPGGASPGVEGYSALSASSAIPPPFACCPDVHMLVGLNVRRSLAHTHPFGISMLTRRWRGRHSYSMQPYVFVWYSPCGRTLTHKHVPKIPHWACDDCRMCSQCLSGD